MQVAVVVFEDRAVLPIEASTHQRPLSGADCDREIAPWRILSTPSMRTSEGAGDGEVCGARFVVPPDRFVNQL